MTSADLWTLYAAIGFVCIGGGMIAAVMKGRKP